jgi:hypothetical protein
MHTDAIEEAGDAIVVALVKAGLTARQQNPLEGLLSPHHPSYSCTGRTAAAHITHLTHSSDPLPPSLPPPSPPLPRSSSSTDAIEEAEDAIVDALVKAGPTPRQQFILIRWAASQPHQSFSTACHYTTHLTHPLHPLPPTQPHPPDRCN